MLESMLVEIINIKMCKYILGVSRKSSNDAVRDEDVLMDNVLINLDIVLKETSFTNAGIPSGMSWTSGGL